jgi:hypothetical protein
MNGKPSEFMVITLTSSVMSEAAGSHLALLNAKVLPAIFGSR